MPRSFAPSRKAASGARWRLRRRSRARIRSLSLSIYGRLGGQRRRARNISKPIRRGSLKRWKSRHRGGPDDRILEMGAYLQITPALHTKLGYGEVRGCYYGRRAAWTIARHGFGRRRAFDATSTTSTPRRTLSLTPTEYFSTVLCCELIEHLLHDPMHLMSEVNRILKPGGHLVLTTPNIAGLRAICGHPAGLSSRIFSRLHPARRGRRDGGPP